MLLIAFCSRQPTTNIPKPNYMKHYLWVIPLVAAAEFYAFSWITFLLRQRSDASVLAGVIGICLLITLNFYLVRSIIAKIKN
jgi:hypothetical protein